MEPLCRDLWHCEIDQLTGIYMWPTLRIARIVNDGQNVYQITFDRVENTIRKPRQKRTAYARNNLCVEKRNLLKAFELKFKSQLKLRAQPLALLLIPIERFADLTNSSTGKFQAVRHEPFFNCAFT